MSHVLQCNNIITNIKTSFGGSNFRFHWHEWNPFFQFSQSIKSHRLLHFLRKLPIVLITEIANYFETVRHLLIAPDLSNQNNKKKCRFNSIKTSFCRTFRITFVIRLLFESGIFAFEYEWRRKWFELRERILQFSAGNICSVAVSDTKLTLVIPILVYYSVNESPFYSGI